MNLTLIGSCHLYSLEPIIHFRLFNTYYILALKKASDMIAGSLWFLQSWKLVTFHCNNCFNGKECANIHLLPSPTAATPLTTLPSSQHTFLTNKIICSSYQHCSFVRGS